jgi:hypothetical protein
VPGRMLGSCQRRAVAKRERHPTAGHDARLAPAGGGPPRNWLRTGIRPSGQHDAMFFVNAAYRFFNGRFGLGAASIFFLSSTPAPGTPPPPLPPIFGLLTPV